MLKIFLSYAKEDRALVSPYFTKLKDLGFDPWMDVECILPGQNWEAEIDRAFNEANVIMLFLSPRSVSKRGFVQREANEAIENLRYKHPSDVYAIPLLLEACEVPPHISKRVQYQDLSQPKAWERVLDSLRLAAKEQQVAITQGVEHGPFRVFSEEIKERWLGLPGHEISLIYPQFTSDKLPQVAKELTSLFQGRAARIAIDSRQKPWDQTPEHFQGEGAEQSFRATNGRWDSFGITFVSNDVLSLVYNVGWYGAGAAHPNYNIQTYNFAFIDGKVYQFDLFDLFRSSSEAASLISEYCIKDLERQFWEKTGGAPDDFCREWIQRGAGPNMDNFAAFSVSRDRLTLQFSPYQVAAYAFGSWTINIPFYDLRQVLREDGFYHLLKQ